MTAHCLCSPDQPPWGLHTVSTLPRVSEAPNTRAMLRPVYHLDYCKVMVSANPQ